MTTEKAGQVLEEIRRLPIGNRMPFRLMGDAVMLSPTEDGKVQVMSIPCGRPDTLASYLFLRDDGQDPHVERQDGSQWLFIANLTWDTIRAYLAPEGLLRPF